MRTTRLLRGGAARTAAMLLVVSAVLVAADTYRTLSHTWDEPCHIAAGLELLDLGTYYYEHQHPPLARVVAALGPYLQGERSARALGAKKEDFWDRQLQCFDEGRRILYAGRRYDRVLTGARAGMLGFLVIGLMVTWAWARQRLGEWPAVLATFFLATTPPFVGNAALATLDVPMAALCVASIFACTAWLERPRPWTAAILGIVTGAAIMTKFSAIPFLATSFVAVVAWRAWRERGRGAWSPILSGGHVKSALIAIGAMLCVFWLCYGLGFTTLADPANRPYESIEGVLGQGSRAAAIASDAVEIAAIPNFFWQIWRGIGDVRHHNRGGHLSFLLGEVRTSGWWHYYLVGLGVKTPLPLLLLGVAGTVLLLVASVRTGEWRLGVPAVAFLAILTFASAYSRINIGIRHVLVLYPLLAFGAAYAVMWLCGRRPKGVAAGLVAVVILWQAVALVAAHPDHMAYFNMLAGGKPERILISADLDWGQDLRRLEQELRRRGVDRVAVTYYGSADLSKHDLPNYRVLKPHTPQTGWIAASLWRLTRNDDHGWLRAHDPVVRVGTSINLYYIRDRP